MQPLLVVELFLKVNQDDVGETHSGKTIQRVLLEFDLEEARTFIGSLQKIEEEIVASEAPDAEWPYD